MTKIKKNILILGGTGFIGRNLIEYFLKEKKFNITATYFKSKKINYPDVNWIKIDLRVEKNFKNLFNKFDIVLQFAATTSGSKDIVNQPYLHVTDNAIMNSLILREVYKSNVKNFIFPSCSVMYHSSNTPLKESKFNPKKNLYPKYFGVGNTKIYIEKLCEFYASIDQKTKYTVARHSNLYGPFDKYDLEKSHMFGANLTKVLNNDNGFINVWGDGGEKRDLLYVKDFCEFVYKAINNQKKNYSLYNVGYGQALSVKKIISLIIKLSNKNIALKFDISKPSIKTSLSLNSYKAKKELSWYPKTNLTDGIKETILWYKDNLLND